MSDTMEIPAKPLPPDTALSRPYWEAARRGQLMVQSCASCGKLRHYPRLLCDACHSTEVHWTELSGRGRIHSWTITHHAFHPAFRDELPLVLVTVDLQEGVRALGHWRGGELSIGAQVQANFALHGEHADLEFWPVP
jgi:uncharacterized OB-fold protein